VKGLGILGYDARLDWPEKADLVVTWNRYGRFDQYCKRQEEDGIPIIVVENGYFGKDTEMGMHFAMALTSHAGAGLWPRTAGPARWRALDLHPRPLYRPAAGYPLRALVLGQRGIGQPGVASPQGWERAAAQKLRLWGVSATIRQHPGNLASQRLSPSLEDAFKVVDFVATWGSGAAVKAMMAGKPVLYDAPKWVGSRGALPMTEESLKKLPFMEDCRELGLQDIAAAQWSAEEVGSGQAIRSLLEIIP